MRVTSIVTLLSVIAAFVCLNPGGAQAQVKASLVATETSVQPNHPTTVALRLEHEPQWHSYWINAGTGYPTTLQWDLPAGWSATGFQWPTPTLIKDKRGNITGHGYSGVVYLPLTLTVPADAKVGENITLNAKASWLMCSDICVPGTDKLSLTLPVSAAAPEPNSEIKAQLARQQMPEQSRRWSFAATRSDRNVEMTVTGAGTDEIKEPHFVSEDAYIQYGGLQEVRPGEPLRMVLPISDEASGTTGKLVGLLTFTDAKGVYRGITVDTALQTPGVAPVAGNATPSTSGDALVFGLAFLGGLILNLMPCVFPVLGIKILGFANEAGGDRRKVTMHGVMFTLGVLISFWALAGALAILRASGDQLGWGFQLQSAPFVFGLTVVMLIFAMSLSGVFEFGLRATGVGSDLQQRSGVGGSFFAGILATVVATPCSAPFLAPALGAALTLPIAQSFAVFTVIGIGLATPYLLLALFPQALQALPRPGAWMNTFKQVMAFPLYATVTYLVWVLAGQTSESGLLTVLFGLTLVAMAVWLYGHYQRPGTGSSATRLSTASALLMLALGLNLGWPRAQAPTEVVWEKWSTERAAQLHAEGRPVYVDFTARWCATCQANKKLVFASNEVIGYVRDKKVALLKADWTQADPLITAELARWKRAAVPFNLVYLPNRADPATLPEVLTPEIVLSALKG